MAINEIPIDNPAGRLHQILLKAKHIAERGEARIGWAKVFDIPLLDNNVLSPEGEKQLIESMIQLRILVDETEQSLRRIDGIPERYFRPFPRITRTPLTDLGLPFGNYINSITEGDLTVLEFCADKLSDNRPEGLVDEEQLKSLLTDVNNLFNEVNSSKLPSDLKKFILQQLEMIHSAIQQYRIRGIERLREVLSTSLGAIIVNGELVKAGSKTEEVSRFSQIFYSFVSIVSFASKATPLIEPISKVVRLLLPGEHNSH
jgi:hypothetical protein